MDAFTHVITGSILAQLPQCQRAQNRHNSNNRIQVSWQKRAVIGSLAAILPDIDYLLFWFNPLDFLAYWHRAETHSMILAPVWAYLLSWLVIKFSLVRNVKLVFSIVFICLLSHIFIDSLTVFGTQWFAPFSDLQIKWNLLFVIDPYFTLSLIFSGILLYFLRSNSRKYWVLLLPCSYLALVIFIKIQLVEKLSPEAIEGQTISMLPQPFSPFYWQLLVEHDQKIQQAYLKYKTDPLASTLSSLFGIKDYSDYFNQITHLHWQTSDNPSYLNNQSPEIYQAWTQPEFKAFNDFSHYPIFIGKTQTADISCYWFSDLRYHWPGIIPAFRYASCRDGNNQWRIKRLKYFSNISQTI